jgi:hypothetical protein
VHITWQLYTLISLLLLEGLIELSSSLPEAVVIDVSGARTTSYMRYMLALHADLFKPFRYHINYCC